VKGGEPCAIPLSFVVQINTRVWLTELSRDLRRPATLDDIPDAELDRLAEMGFEWVWFLSVWQTGQAGQQVSRSNPDGERNSRRPCRTCGRGYCRLRVCDHRYTVHQALGGMPLWHAFVKGSGGAACG